jgi:hypothetical protein
MASGQRFIAIYWDDSLPPAEAAKKAGAPAASLLSQSVFVILCFGRLVPVGDCHFHLGSNLVDRCKPQERDERDRIQLPD